MFLLISFITIWALSPGPVAVLTIQRARKNGRRAGVAVSSGASVTAVMMVVAALLVHNAGFSALLQGNELSFIEQLGALGIIMMGIYAAYQCLFNSQEGPKTVGAKKGAGGFVRGMMMMATYIPQALIFYNVIVPQTVAQRETIPAILALGALKVALIWVWHTGIAVVVTRRRTWVGGTRFGRLLDFAAACLIIGMGVNILL
jgi:threonine/homoserine/homoserine lactone efflux protein